MSNPARLRRLIRAAVCTGTAAGLVAGAVVSAVPASAAAGAEVSAVVALSGPTAVRAPGIRVTALLPAVGAELVRGTPGALAALARSGRVRGVRLDGPVRPTGAGFEALGTDGVFAWQGLGPKAGTTNAGHGVTVALVDTGISDNAALNRASGRLVDGVDTSPLLAGDAPLTTGTFTDGFGHGTFLASLLAGGPVPGSGRALGVAPAARVVSVKVADNRGRTSLAAVLAGLDWVATHRPIDVVVLALAADRPGASYGADPLALAVSHLRKTGLAVVAAAGNDPTQLGDPGFDPKAITVGAADTTGWLPRVAPFSGSGVVAGIGKPDLVAAGVHLLGLLPPDSYVARNFPGARQDDGFWRGSGTSEAAAIAGGVAAIYLAEHPGASAQQVKLALRGAARPLGGWSAAGRAGRGLLAVPAPGTAGDLGEWIDRTEWWANAWDEPGWVNELADSWSTGVWTAKSWSSNPWAGDQWSAKTWSAKTWSAKTWSAKTWSVKTWSAKTWSFAARAPYEDLFDGPVGP